MSTKYIRWFSEVVLADVPTVGGKNASLGEMYQSLTREGIRVPNGFAITADAYRAFVRDSHIETDILRRLQTLDTRDVTQLRETGHSIRHMILAAPYPQGLAQEITEAYAQLSGTQKSGVDVAVRSSATAEDLPDASFAGQQETFLNVQGPQALLEMVRRCFASLFTDRAISYRVDKGFAHDKVALSVGVQVMVRSDLASSGVMFSIDTETGFRNAVLINAAYGLGENVVQGAVNPDEYYVFKPTLLEGKRPILQRMIGSKEFKLIYDEGGGRMTKNVPVSVTDRERLVLSDDEILLLARWACRIEEYYSQLRGTFTPMDIEWAKDGNTQELFIVQARPETVQSQRDSTVIESFRLLEKGEVLITGRSVGERVASGPVRVVKTSADLVKVKAGDVLVADKTDPDWEPSMKVAAAIITNRGGRTCHAAIVSRELGVPAVVGCMTATDLLRDDHVVTVSCAEGDIGRVYDGALRFEATSLKLTEQARPKTKIMLNIAKPEDAFRLSQLPCDGVGLARLEFIITDYIKVHPMALVHYDRLLGTEDGQKIAALTRGFSDKREYFVSKLAEGVAMLGAAFYPRDVIVRMSDFKTNEYANLVGGRDFEPTEENPMIGFRGASRYYSPRYRAGFELECQALKRVRNDMGLTNVKVMIPFCRTVNEAKQVLSVMESAGLKRGEGGLEVYVMCEIPSNVILVDQFSECFDGFSIGSNDLTQLTLGVDRDSELLASIFDERNDAVTRFIRQAIRGARQHQRKIGICGQAPSDYPDFARFLVEEGIDSISLNPDVAVKMLLTVKNFEAEVK